MLRNALNTSLKKPVTYKKKLLRDSKILCYQATEVSSTSLISFFYRCGLKPPVISVVANPLQPRVAIKTDPLGNVKVGSNCCEHLFIIARLDFFFLIAKQCHENTKTISVFVQLSVLSYHVFFLSLSLLQIQFFQIF